MEIERISHKARRKFAEKGKAKAKGLIEPARPLKLLAFIDAVESFDELAVPPNYGLHELSGDRAGTYAMTVTRNWRLTFTKFDDQTIADLNLEDYH